MLRKNVIWLCLLIGVIVTACSISYKFNGASIDYTKVKTITVKDFPNQAPLVYPPLSQEFTEALKDIYIRQTRLQMVNNNGDLELEGEREHSERRKYGYDRQMTLKPRYYQALIIVQVCYPNRRSSWSWKGKLPVTN